MSFLRLLIAEKVFCDKNLEVMVGKIYGYQKVEGKHIAGIIHNGNYFFTAVGVYEDGAINCWEKVEYHNIKDVIDREWLCCEIPTGEDMSISQLGMYEIKSANWKYNRETYYKSIIDTIKKLNPEIEKLNEIMRRIPQKECNQKFIRDSHPFKKAKGLNWWSQYDGDNTFVFYNLDGKLYLITLTAYEDKTFEISMLEGKYFSLEEIREMFEKDILTTEVKDGFIIDELGEIEIGKTIYFVEKKDKLIEIEDMMKKISGEEDSLDLCQKAYFEYLKEPSEYNKKRLKETYENVPEHERRFLGDMDSKDSDYCRIIYTDRKREV